MGLGEGERSSEFSEKKRSAPGIPSEFKRRNKIQRREDGRGAKKAGGCPGTTPRTKKNSICRLVQETKGNAQRQGRSSPGGDGVRYGH